MSILIKGIDLPKKVNHHFQLIFYSADESQGIMWEGFLKDRVFEIPTPHGRLIDASELIKSYMKGTKTDIDDFYDTIEIIDNAPTIVEAEE